MLKEIGSQAAIKDQQSTIPFLVSKPDPDGAGGSH
jgi:hypothetical protein